jgi:hypothetical protein
MSSTFPTPKSPDLDPLREARQHVAGLAERITAGDISQDKAVDELVKYFDGKLTEEGARLVLKDPKKLEEHLKAVEGRGARLDFEF